MAWSGAKLCQGGGVRTFLLALPLLIPLPCACSRDIGLSQEPPQATMWATTDGGLSRDQGPDPQTPVQPNVPEPEPMVAAPPAFDKPAGWPDARVDGAELPLPTLDSRCAQDARGNWVCVWGPGTGIAGGPCAFGADGSVAVASSVSWPDFAALGGVPFPETREMSTVVIKHTADGVLEGARVWHRAGRTKETQIAPFALVVDAQGVTTWAGEDCVVPSPHGPAADGGYAGSCLDAYVAALDPQGDLLWQWSFGTALGLERVSDMLLAPKGGLYLAGDHHAPLELPEHAPLGSHGGTDHYLMRLDQNGDVTWTLDWGTAEHDGNNVRLAQLPDGDIAVSQHLGLDATDNGLLTRVTASGQEQQPPQTPGLYISRVAHLGRDLVVTLADGAVVRVANDGQTSPLIDAASGLGIARFLATPEGTLLVASQTGDQVIELDQNGTLLRTHRYTAPESLWYQGGFCAGPDGRVAISATITSSSTFGILSEPLVIERRMAFLLVLNDW